MNTEDKKEELQIKIAELFLEQEVFKAIGGPCAERLLKEAEDKLNILLDKLEVFHKDQYL